MATTALGGKLENVLSPRNSQQLFILVEKASNSKSLDYILKSYSNLTNITLILGFEYIASSYIDDLTTKSTAEVKPNVTTPLTPTMPFKAKNNTKATDKGTDYTYPYYKIP